MLKNYLILLMLALFNIGYAQTYGKFIDDSLKNLEANDSLIVWKTNVKLHFLDFKGLPDTNSIGNAATYSFIIPIYTVYPHFKCKVFAFFNSKESWIKRDISNVKTLAHEQGHFDIAKIYADKMQFKIKKLKFTDSIHWKIYSLYNEMNNQLDSVQNLYDKETNNSRNEKMQIIWNKKINH